MKKALVFLAPIFLFGVLALPSRADQLDDVIDVMRTGASINQGRAMEAIKETQAAASKAYNDSMVDLYLWEIKASIIDPDNQGGWPCRSFLVEGNPDLRKQLTKALRDRFEDKPDPILVYAVICPAIYAGDDALVGRLEAYLKANDPFLFRVEQTQVDKFWRPYIKSTKETGAAPGK